MPSSFNLDADGKGQASSGWALHELAENHQFASGVIVSLLALAMAFGIIGLIAALPHSNLGELPEKLLTQTRKLQHKEDIMDTPQAFVRSVAQHMDDAMAGVHHQWVDHDASPPHHAVAGKGTPEHGIPHRG